MAATATESASLRLSTDALPPRDRIAIWREEFGRSMLRVDIEPLGEGPLYAAASMRTVSGFRSIRCDTSRMRFDRTKALIPAGEDQFGLAIILEGRGLLSQRGRDIVVGPGDAVTISHQEPATLIYPGGGHFGSVFPMTALAPLVGDVEAIAARRIPRGSEALRLLVHYLNAIQEELSPGRPDLDHLVATHVYDLVAMAIGATRDGEEIALRRGVRAARLRAVKADIIANLASRDLTVAAVALRQRVTPRYVHLLCEDEGTTFSQFVLATRLGRAHEMLADPRHDHLTITAIAYGNGFGDLSHFNHAFRRRYGATPKDVRRRVG